MNWACKSAAYETLVRIVKNTPRSMRINRNGKCNSLVQLRQKN